MSDEPVYVSFPNRFKVEKEILNATYAQLLLLEAEGKGRYFYYYYLWELVQKGRNPTTFKISEKGVKDLFERGLLDENGVLDYITQEIVLHTVVGDKEKIRVITLNELLALLS